MAAQSQICWAFYSPNFHSHRYPHHHRNRNFLTMAASSNATTSLRLRRRTASCHATTSTEATETPPSPPASDQELQRKVPDLQTLVRRFWKVAAPYWFSDDKNQARLQLAAVFALTLGTTGIGVGFNFLGRDFYNALANKDQEQFAKQLLYYLGAFAGGIPVSTQIAAFSH